jgi:hypothetical protein
MLKKTLLYESEETKELSTSQLQRMALLQQIELDKIQLERERLQISKMKNNCDKSTQTDDDLGEFLIFKISNENK